MDVHFFLIGRTIGNRIVWLAAFRVFFLSSKDLGTGGSYIASVWKLLFWEDDVFWMFYFFDWQNNWKPNCLVGGVSCFFFVI